MYVRSTSVIGGTNNISALSINGGANVANGTSLSSYYGSTTGRWSNTCGANIAISFSFTNIGWDHYAIYLRTFVNHNYNQDRTFSFTIDGVAQPGLLVLKNIVNDPLL